ncbi:MAG TPA: hypothetical protein HPP54_08160 [Nitrospinae bacterium]|nr:hypothetical protein [Nitrospinota bacterium]
MEVPEKEDFYGFVYLITNCANGKKYVGKKFFWSMKTRQVKGKKKRFLAESDWQDYWGSNAQLKEDVETAGKANFQREILHLCKTKSECSYFEAKEQIDREVLLSDDYYNSWISLKVTKKHLAKYAKRRQLTETQNGV